MIISKLEPPFNLTPNSRFFFEGNKHKEALDSLLYAINQRKGFIVITGEIGSGKTTVSRALINKLDEKYRSGAYHQYPCQQQGSVDDPFGRP